MPWSSSPTKTTLVGPAGGAQSSLGELLRRASSRVLWEPDDSRSGARFERLVIAGERYVLKYQDARDDWHMRATGDDGQRYLRLWQQGVLAGLPGVIDHAVVAADRDGPVGRILLRDVPDQLVAVDAPFASAQHARLLEHMAALHRTFWEWHDDVGLTTLSRRYLAFSPTVARAEAALGDPALVPRPMSQGWARLRGEAPRLARVVFPLLKNPTPLVLALGSVPHTLVHGDWKAGNLGSHADGRTILLDFGEVPGEASPLADLSWYLALNADMLPESEEATIDRYRAALDAKGVDTGPWWERAVALELLGTMLQFGWEKGLAGRGVELDWWESQALRGSELL